MRTTCPMPYNKFYICTKKNEIQKGQETVRWIHPSSVWFQNPWIFCCERQTQNLHRLLSSQEFPHPQFHHCSIEILQGLYSQAPARWMRHGTQRMCAVQPQAQSTTFGLVSVIMRSKWQVLKITHPDSQKLWTCSVTWQKGLCDYPEDAVMMPNYSWYIHRGA